MDERRENPRFYCDRERDYLLDVAGKKDSGRLLDLSRNGIAFESLSRHRQDQVCHLKIKTDVSQESIPCQARVMWVRAGSRSDRTRCGARIIKMDTTAKMDILDRFYKDWKQRILYKKEAQIN